MRNLTDEREAALQEAVTTLLDPGRVAGTFDEELLAAGTFVARFGSLGDLYEEPDLTRMQFAGLGTNAWSMLGHWSVEREDPKPEPPAWFEEHAKNDLVCRYLESAYGIYMTFDVELCDQCGLDVEDHDIVADVVMGLAHAHCREGED